VTAPTAQYTSAEATKLSGIEASADVTDATNVASALANGVAALTSGEVTQLANIGTEAISAAEWGYVAGATAAFADNSVTLARMASGTDGNIISYDASGNPVAVATGNDGQVLTSTGAGSPPAFEDAAAGGGGAMEFISKTTITGTPSSIDITGLDDDSVYKIIFPYVILSASLFPYFKMYDHTDTLISADYSYRREDSSVLTVASGATEMNAYGASGTTWNAEFTLVTKAGSASFYMQQFAPTGNDSDDYCRVSGGFDDTLYASGIGGLSLYPASGTFTGGQYRIYKLKDS
jgi:hypothetical protein